MIYWKHVFCWSSLSKLYPEIGQDLIYASCCTLFRVFELCKSLLASCDCLRITKTQCYSWTLHIEVAMMQWFLILYHPSNCSVLYTVCIYTFVFELSQVRSIDIAEKCKVMFMEGHIQAKKKEKNHENKTDRLIWDIKHTPNSTHLKQLRPCVVFTNELK